MKCKEMGMDDRVGANRSMPYETGVTRSTRAGRICILNGSKAGRLTNDFDADYLLLFPSFVR